MTSKMRRILMLFTLPVLCAGLSTLCTVILCAEAWIGGVFFSLLGLLALAAAFVRSRLTGWEQAAAATVAAILILLGGVNLL